MQTAVARALHLHTRVRACNAGENLTFTVERDFEVTRSLRVDWRVFTRWLTVLFLSLISGRRPVSRRGATSRPVIGKQVCDGFSYRAIKFDWDGDRKGSSSVKERWNKGSWWPSKILDRDRVVIKVIGNSNRWLDQVLISVLGNDKWLINYRWRTRFHLTAPLSLE